MSFDVSTYSSNQFSSSNNHTFLEYIDEVGPYIQNKTFFSDANRCTFDKVPYGMNMSNRCYTSLKAWYANSQSKMGGCGRMERAAKQVAVSFGHLVNAFIVDVALIVYDVMMATFFLVANACTLFLSDELRERLGGHLYSAVSVLSSNIFKNVITALYPPAVYRSEDAINVNDQINDPNGDFLRTFPSLHLQMLRTCERNGKPINFPKHSLTKLFPLPDGNQTTDVLFGWAINYGLSTITFSNEAGFDTFQEVIQENPQHHELLKSVRIAQAFDESCDLQESNNGSTCLEQILKSLNLDQLNFLIFIDPKNEAIYERFKVQ